MGLVCAGKDRPRLSSSKISGAKINNNEIFYKIPRGGKKLASFCSGVVFATPCHPMATISMMATGLRQRLRMYLAERMYVKFGFMLIHIQI